MDARGGGGWEQTKENILPLSSGRRMAHLTEALPNRTATGLTDHLQYEEHHMKEVEKLEAVAKQNLGDDPLQAWVDAIKYINQHFPNMSPAVKKKHIELLRLTVRTFFGDERYHNDERYIWIAIQSFMDATSPTLQIKCLNDFLNRNIGELVSATYIRLAELYDAEGDTKKASETLKEGLRKNAQPKQNLEEMLTHIQETWARNYAKMLENNDTLNEGQSNSRNFAAAVPVVGEKNEAITYRQNLQAAAPTTNSRYAPGVRQNAGPQRLEVFNEENADPQSSVSHDRPSHDQPERLQALENNEHDRENRLDACRWNSRHTHLDNPAIPEPPEKLQLYVEPEVASAQSSVNKSSQQVHNVSNRVLKERKEEIEPPETEAIPAVLQPEAERESVKVKTGESTSSSSSLESKQVSKEPVVAKKAFTWKRNYDPNKKDNFFENIKYKPLPRGHKVNRIMLNADKWFEAKEKQIKEEEANEHVQLRKQVEELSKKFETVCKEMDQLKVTTSQESQHLENKIVELKSHYCKLMEEKEDRISRLESQNEELMNQLTRMTTDKNRQDSLFDRLKTEKLEVEQQLKQARKTLEEERTRYQEELQDYKRKCENFKDSNSKRVKHQVEEDENQCAKEWSHLSLGKKQSFVDIDVRSRTVEVSSSPSSSNQGISDTSQFPSGETTVEYHQQSVVGSSFMPQLDDDKSLMMSMEIAPAPRKALGMVERGLGFDNDALNITPAAPPPVDFEIPAPCMFMGPKFGRPKKMSLYESMHDASLSHNIQKSSGAAENKRVDVVRNLQALSENQAPPVMATPSVTPSVPVAEEPPTFAVPSLSNFRNDEPFRMPAIPSDENAPPAPTLAKPRRSILLGRPYMRAPSSDEDEDEEEIILRRHQQTGLDLNMSNLTCALMMAPKPLINSTPEKEKTLRDLPPIPPRNLAQQQHDTDDAPPRFSILNEPPLNLSTIQETSREYRSRSTTGSSSGTTMSTTRFGNATSTQLNGNSRSSSIPRSASRVSQHNNNNGYYSDTNQ